jgi:hypothetical protein
MLPAVSIAADTQRTQQNVMTEITFTSQSPHADPFNDVTLDVIFSAPDGAPPCRVPAFWDGGTTWKVRYASPVIGLHHFHSECSDQKDVGLNGIEGAVQVDAYKGDNSLYIHGPLRVATGSRYLEHIDGTPFFWLGDTWWMGLTNRLDWPDEFKLLAQDRKQKGFDLIQIIAGLYPDMPAFDPRGANETGYPWEKEYARIRPEYFDAADKKIQYLVDQGFVPCIVGTWGYHLPWLGQQKMEQHQRYLYARWGALPMVWCIAGELNMPYYQSPEFHQDWNQQANAWKPVIQYCRSINCFNRPITSHPSGPDPLSMRTVLKDAGLIDFDMLQTPHGQMEVIGTTVETVRMAYGLKPPMPVVNAEPSYEMLFDRTPAEIARMVFWMSWECGVKGYTYGANGIWQLNGKNKPYGLSASGGDYGKISWEQAMNLAGSSQVAMGKRLLEQYPWQRFEPHQDWASWSSSGAQTTLGDWIWFPEGDPAQNAPIAARYFRRSFELPVNAKIRRATLRIAADDRCTVWINGNEIGSQDTWHAARQFDNFASKLTPNNNVIAIRAENVNTPGVTANPAGLICGLTIELEDGTLVKLKSDGEWLTDRSGPDGWQRSGFLDSDWSRAKVVAANGSPPWGNIDNASDGYIVPYSMGIARQIRIIYVPQSKSIVVKGLEPDVGYSAYYFDPATGKQAGAPAISADANKECQVEAPSFGHDWVLVMDAKK